MLYIVLVAAVVFYVMLFTLWGAVRPALDQSAQYLSGWRDVVVFASNHGEMLLLKEMILVTVIYLAADAASSHVRRSRARRPRHPEYHSYDVLPISDSVDEFLRH